MNEDQTFPTVQSVSPTIRSKVLTNQCRQNIPCNTVQKSIQLDQKILQFNLTVLIIIIKILYHTDTEFL